MEEINNTPINTSETNKWLSDLEIDEYNLFPEESHLNFLDADEDEFLSHDIASVFEEQTKQQCLTSECTSTTLSNSFTDETCFESFDFDFERQTKQLKTIDSDDNIIETFSTKLSSSSSNSSFQSQILCFDPSINTQQNEVVSVPQPQLGTKGSSKNQNLESQNKRSRANSHDHIMAERLRREKLSVSFIALGALIPGLKKMDKATVLADAIKYVKELKERLEVLEEQNNKTKADSVEIVTKPDLCSDDENSSSDESIEGAAESLFQVDAKVSGKEILIRIHCKKLKGLLVKIISEIQRFQLFVVKNSLLPFGESILDITVIAQMGEGYNLTTKELVKKLREAALKFMSLS